MTRKQRFFTCIVLSRDDLVQLGYKNAARLSDKTMETIACETGLNDMVMSSWWAALENTCDRMELQKREEEP